MSTLRRTSPIQRMLIAFLLSLGLAVLLKFAARTQEVTGSPWRHVTVGTTPAAGSVREEVTGVLTIESKGGEIGAGQDAFEFNGQPMIGDGEVVVRVDGLTATNVLAKAGLMIRQSLSANSPHVLLAATRGQGLAFLWRQEEGGASQTTGLGKLSGTNWMKLVRMGDWFGAYISPDGNAWTRVEWRKILMSAQVNVGVAVCGGGDNAIAQARFEQLRMSPVATADFPPRTGAGDGLLGKYFTTTNMSGVPEFAQVDPAVDFNWRFGFPAGLRQADHFGIRWSGELEAQFTEPYTIHLRSDDGARVWLDGNLVLDNWKPQPFEEKTVTVDLVAGSRYPIKVEYFEDMGIAAVQLRWSSPSTPERVIPESQLYSAALDTNRYPGTLLRTSWAERTKDAVGPLSSDWLQNDVGEGAGGGAVETNGVKIIRGVGDSIWGTADAFHYVYQKLNGNGAILTRVLEINGGEPWAKAGLMIRESLAPDARHASLFGTHAHGLLFDYRPATGGQTFDSTDLRYRTLYWLKLERWGNFLSGYASTNGQEWRLVDRVVIDMPPEIYIGLAVNSQAATSECTAWMDHVQLTNAQPPGPLPILGSGDGLRAEYFANSSLAGKPVLVRVEPRLDFDWHGSPPIPNSAEDQFSARWSGEIQAQYSEEVTFRLTHLHDARVWLNEHLLMDSSRSYPSLYRKYIQASANFVAGQKYLLRVECYNCRDDALGRLMWSSPSVVRRTTPPSQLYSQPTDSDEDGLPDLWEKAYDLDPSNPSDAAGDPDRDGLSNLEEYAHFTNPRQQDSDADGIPDLWEIRNGLGPTIAEDGAGDADHDGLSNTDEYRAGTSPNLADTDGDGLSDGMEVVEMKTDPLSRNITSITTVAEVAGSDAVARLGGWAVDGKSIYALDGRGYVEYSLSAPTNDMYRVEIAGGSHFSFDRNPQFQLIVSVDGQSLSRLWLSNAVACLTPWLKAGEHRLRIYWDNAAANRSIQISAVRLQQLEGPDADWNGVKDWAEGLLLATCGVDLAPARSLTSPVCLEGRGRFTGLMTISGGIAPQPAPNNRWYADIPLAPEMPNTVICSFENGGLLTTNRIVWQPVNLLTSGDLTIRRDDALLLQALPEGLAEWGDDSKSRIDGSVEITVAGVTNYSSKPDQPVVHRFNEDGTYNVIGRYIAPDGTRHARTIAVKVIFASLGEPAAAWTTKRRAWHGTNLSAGISLETDSRYRLEARSETNRNEFWLTVDEPETRYLAVRLGTNGPIVSSLPVQGTRLFGAPDTYNKTLEQYDDGSRLVETMLVLSPMLTNVTVEVNIVVGGVTFDDGTVHRELTANDFNALGQCPVRFVMPLGVRTANCHSLRLRQGQITVGTY